MWMAAAPLCLSEPEETILRGLARAPSTPQGIAMRARIVLLAGEGLANTMIAERLSISRPTVLLWRGRYAKRRTAGILTIEKGRGRKPEVPVHTVEKIIRDTLYTTPPAATHWSCRSLARKHGVSHNFVKEVWQANGLKPHLVKTFKLSNDPHFVDKLRDVVGLYLNPPEHAFVLSIDEKTQIQALDRTQPALPLRRGHAGTVTHDYKRNGTTTLFAALNILKGDVIGVCIRKHRHQEFLRFLKRIDTVVARHYDVHCIVDNYATHKHPRVKAWLAKHSRFHFHFIPTSSSWLNLVERWFREITQKRIRRGSFRSERDLIQAIEAYIEENNKNPRPFVWTKTADEIIRKVNRCKPILNTLH